MSGDLFSALANFINPPAIVREVDLLRVKTDALRAAALAVAEQEALIARGFSRERAFAQAVIAFVHARPRIEGASGAHARRLSQKRERAIRALADAVVIEEQVERAKWDF